MAQASLTDIYCFGVETRIFFNSIYPNYREQYNTVMGRAKNDQKNQADTIFGASKYFTQNILAKVENRPKIFNFLKTNENKFPKNVRAYWEKYSEEKEITSDRWNTIILKINIDMMFLALLDIKITIT